MPTVPIRLTHTKSRIDFTVGSERVEIFDEIDLDKSPFESRLRQRGGMMGKVFDSLFGWHGAPLPRRGAGALLMAAGASVAIAFWGPSNMAAPNRAAPALENTTSFDSVRLDVPALAATPFVVQTADDRLPEVFVPGREWRQVKSGFWQIVGPVGEDPAVTDEREGGRGSCGMGQVEVQGKMKVHSMMDELQMQSCANWIDRKWPERCGAFDRDKWLAASKDLPTQPMHFCIDRYEYPNRKAEYPVIMVTWYEARDTCKADGKRLCTEDEWTFACEGEEATPYPNGYRRDADACLNDKQWRQFHGEALMPRKAAMKELDHLWQGEPSGTRDKCKSSFGVHDLTGNVDEWTRSSVAGERPSVLKGGYWGPVRTRCRPATKAHDESHTFYQQGFRCCGDPSMTTAAR